MEQVRRLRNHAARAGRVLVLLTGILFALVASASADTSTLIEGEDYWGWNDIGGNMIGVEWCSTASGEYTVDHIDVPGEWVRLTLTLASSGCYSITVGYQAYNGAEIDLRVTIEKGAPTGEDVHEDFSLIGWGIG
jgi:hypothetical protein